jgi:hypothetical protein
MLGKGAILTVFGFILAFSMYQVRMSSNVLTTSDNSSSQYLEALMHETAMSAINIAINKVWDQGVTKDSFNVKVNSCSSRVKIFPVGSDTTKIAVTTWGYMYDSEAGVMHKEQESMSAFFARGISSLTDYFYFTNNMAGLFWVTGCTLWGPFHTNTVVHTMGAPVFYGKVTAKLGINPDPAKKGHKAEYHDGWEVGVDMTIPADMTHLVNAAIAGNGGPPGGGGAAMNTKTLYDQDVSFEFLANGDVIRTVSGVTDTVAVVDIAPTGAIYSMKDVRVKGVLNGAVTIYTTDNIWIDDDITYANNPLVDVYSDDILGLVSKGNTYITDNDANNDGEVHIFANIVTIEGRYQAENYWKRPKGVEYFCGSQAQDACGAHGVANSKGSVIKGYEGRLRYDPRFDLGLIVPPNYPGIPKLSLASWWE